jgi:hypothetical protein
MAERTLKGQTIAETIRFKYVMERSGLVLAISFGCEEEHHYC